MSETEIFIIKAKEVHDDKYDYSKVNYINSQTKVCIICPKHGEFWQTPYRHLEGRNCIKCAAFDRNKLRLSNNKDFIEKAKLIHKHNDGTQIFDYSKVNYSNSSTKVCIIDHRINPVTGNEFGEFWQTPNKHLSGRGNEKYSYVIERGINKRISKIEFIEKAKNVQKHSFDYTNTVINGTGRYLSFVSHDINPITGEEYGKMKQLMSHHLNGVTPKLIKSAENGINRRKTNKQFIFESKKKHGNKYDYSKTNYVKDNQEVCIICKEHGEFWQSPNKHLNYHGCPKCKTSKLQTKVRVLLENNNIEYIEECSRKTLKFIKDYRMDFYLPRYNLVIECQGGQHFYPVKRFGGTIAFELNKFRDKDKFEICKQNGINIVYFSEKKEFKDEYYNSELLNNIYSKENIFFNENSLFNYINNIS